MPDPVPIPMVSEPHFQLPSPRPAASRAEGNARSAPGGARVCLLTPFHPERALSLALVQHLSEELPDVHFTLEDRGGVDVVWVCGYERGQAELVRAQRLRHPQAQLLVTSRTAPELWADEALAAGADDVLSWPIELARLARALRRRPLQRRA